MDIIAKLRVINRRNSLVMIYAVQSHAEDVHGVLHMATPTHIENALKPKRRAGLVEYEYYMSEKQGFDFVHHP